MKEGSEERTEKIKEEEREKCSTKGSRKERQKVAAKLESRVLRRRHRQALVPQSY
jgi:hypothetical protein